MSKMYTVCEGDTLSIIAKKFNFKRWQPIYYHDKNCSFRKQHPDPDLIYPGDKLFIPDKIQKKSKIPSGSNYQARVNGNTVTINLQLIGIDDEPLVFTKYTLETSRKSIVRTASGKENIPADDPPYSYNNFKNGLVYEEVPRNNKKATLEATLRVWLDDEDDEEPSFEQTLNIVFFKPIEKTTGMQTRLQNLGFYDGIIDGDFGPITKDALKSFQGQNKLLVSGEIDNDTYNKLREVYGC